VTALDEQIGGSHYKDFKIQPVEFIHRNGIDFLSGNVIKYVCRWKSKGGLNDLEKAKHYIELLIELSTNKSYEVDDIGVINSCNLCLLHHSINKNTPHTCDCKCHNKIKYPTEGCENCISFNQHSTCCECECHGDTKS
jgi:hypothetical protein